MVSSNPVDAGEIVRRVSNGEGLLSNDGASVGNLFSGDAVRSYITMATIKATCPLCGDVDLAPVGSQCTRRRRQHRSPSRRPGKGRGTVRPKERE